MRDGTRLALVVHSFLDCLCGGRGGEGNPSSMPQASGGKVALRVLLAAQKIEIAACPSESRVCVAQEDLAHRFRVGQRLGKSGGDAVN